MISRRDSWSDRISLILDSEEAVFIHTPEQYSHNPDLQQIILSRDQVEDLVYTLRDWLDE